MIKKFYIFFLMSAVLFVFLTSCNANTVSEKPIVKDQFVLKSGAYHLNAVYTYIDDGEKHPAVLLIAGYGPADCDSTLGALKPFADIADALAQKGICSLRVDKRTLNYGAAFSRGGIEEEYLEDCRTAISYLKDQPAVGDLYLLGHSLGGQIACILQNETENISGTICFNSSLRHLADVACDQYSATDAANKNQYRQYADLSKAATKNTATGLYYYGAQDYYWASYNEYDFADLAKNSSSPMLVINSTRDLQSFESDISLWSSTLQGSTNATILVDDTISHFGYEIDLSSPDALTQNHEFPQKIIDAFANFINRVE